VSSETLQDSRTLTPAQLRARRSNAQSSTGPRTERGKRQSRLNSTQHGYYSRAFGETLLALKEDPAEFERLYQRLLGDFHSPGAVLDYAVQELAELDWELDRERRFQNRLRQRSLDALDQEAARRRQELETDEYDRPGVGHHGLVAAEACPDRYKALLDQLDELIAQVEQRNFKSYGRPFFLVYGDGELRGVAWEIKQLFWRLSGEMGDRFPPADRNTAPELRRLLAAEREKYRQEYEAFKPDYPTITERDRERARWLEMLDEEAAARFERSQEREAALRRAIDRKIRTILAIQRERRLEEAHEARLRLAEAEARSAPNNGDSGDSGARPPDACVASTADAVGEMALASGQPVSQQARGSSRANDQNRRNEPKKSFEINAGAAAGQEAVS
jgi:hypothetical protein